MRRKALTTSFSLFLLFGMNMMVSADQPYQQTINFKDFARADWGKEIKNPADVGPKKNAGWVEFEIDAPSTGWYELYALWGNYTHELFLDGRKLYYGGAVLNPGDPVPPKGAPRKLANLPLTAGKHTVRFQRLGRVGFPASWPEQLIIKQNTDKPASALLAIPKSIDVVRLGESIRFEMTGGALPVQTKYAIFAKNLMSGKTSKVAEVSFPAGKELITRQVEIHLPEEGCYVLTANSGDATLSAAEFRPFQLAVVDTTTKPVVKAEIDKTLIIDLDCVKQTINGKPIPKDKFFEGNGESRIRETGAGIYRETGDGLAPGVEKSNVVSEMFSGFTYHLDIPPSMEPYILEVDYPDDDWRYTMVLMTNYDGKWNAKKPKGFLPPTSGVLSGGPYDISHKMLTHRIAFWTHSPKMALTILSGRLGHRSAASKIRVYKVNGELPALFKPEKNGRVCSTWNEQRDDWKWIVNAKGTLPRDMPQLQQDYIAIKRLVALNAFSGMNAFWSTDVSYQQAWHMSEILEGYLPHGTEHSRLAVLLCEKYGLKYYSEIFLGGQYHFANKVLGELADNIEDLRTYNFQGLDANVGGFAPKWNIAHPEIQRIMIDIYGELADKLGDSPAFGGICARISGWLWDGLYSFTSLYWGYGDYTIARFEKETGIKVPGKEDDPARFETRYNFLTSPEMKERWIRWRSDLVMNFLRRMSARIRLKNPDAVLFLAGDAQCDFLHGSGELEDKHVERFFEMGIDIKRLEHINGIAVMPTGGYGRGKAHNYLAEQRSVDSVTDEDYIDLGKGAIRSFAFGNQYDEWGNHIRFEDLGIPKVHRIWVTGASNYAGRHGLARYASVLAEQDSMILRDGGYGWTWGNRDIRGPWLNEFTKIPRIPFKPLEFARDPVAVWYLNMSDPSDSSDAFFYVVNREGLPMTLVLEFLGTKNVTRLGTGETIALRDGALKLELKSYELRAFRAPSGTRITKAETVLPDGYLESIKNRLAEAQHDEQLITAGRFAENVTYEQRQAYQSQLNKAWKAFGNGHFWKTRTLLKSAPMMVVYEQIGRLPKGQVVTRFPNMLQYNPGDRYEPDFPVLTGEALKNLVIGEAIVDDSSTYNSEWQGSEVIKSKDGKLRFKLPLLASGPYRLSIGYVSATSGVITAAVNGQSLPTAMATQSPNTPEKNTFPIIELSGKFATLALDKTGEFGVYAICFEPVLRVLPTTLWSTIGPFGSFWRRGGEGQSSVRDGFAYVYPPQKGLPLDQTCETRDGVNRRWSQTDKIVGSHADVGVNFAFRCKSGSFDICFAETFITSPKDQKILLYIGTDWWATAYVNGKEVEPVEKHAQKEFNCAFNRWKPRAAIIELRKGVNKILVKNHGGSANNWFSARISDLKDLGITPEPPLN